MVYAVTEDNGPWINLDDIVGIDRVTVMGGDLGLKVVFFGGGEVVFRDDYESRAGLIEAWRRHLDEQGDDDEDGDED